MEYSEVINKAKEGKYLKLPNYEGYFYWNFYSKKLIFRNGDYINENMGDKVKNRND